MGIVIQERKNKHGSSWHVRWNRRREDRPRCVYLGRWPEKKYAEAQRDRALQMLAETGDVSLEALGRRAAANTVNALADKWLANSHVGASAQKAKQGHANRIRRRWGNRAPTSITKDDVQTWINEMVHEGLGRGTIVNHLNSLRPLLRTGEIDPPWLRGVKGLSIPYDDYEAMILPDARAREAVRSRLSLPQQAIFDIIEHGGLRTSEACSLTWRQVAPEMLVTIGTKYVRKGGKPPRNVRVMPELDQPAWVPLRPTGDFDKDARVFPSESANGRSFQDAVAKACEDAGVSMLPKDLRHLHATRLMHASIAGQHSLGLHGMAKRMGHDQHVFLSRYSDHPLPDED